MNWQDFGVGVALVLVIEGILPFLTPKGLRQAYLRVAQLPDNQIRAFGLISMISGVFVLYLVR
jgi:uncharacterized protein YjeT (DUF2065 family)